MPQYQGNLTSACMKSIFPSVGYASASSTQVTIAMSGPFPAATAKPPKCQFGTTVVPGSYRPVTTGGTSIVCTAPAIFNKETVPLSVSIDGSNFTAGVIFTYFSECSNQFFSETVKLNPGLRFFRSRKS